MLREHADGARVGVVGYCMGARLAVRAAALDDDIVAVAGFHGGGLAVEGDPDEPPHPASAARTPSSSSATPTRTGGWTRPRSPDWARLWTPPA